KIIGLPALIESHHDYRRAIAADQLGLPQEFFLAVLERDQIDHAFPLGEFQARFDDAPFRAVDHHRNARDFRFAANEIRKRVMVASESSIPSSTLMSIIFAPFATCWRAIVTAPSKSPPRISFENFGEPVIFVRSPMTANPKSDVMFSGSRPES